MFKIPSDILATAEKVHLSILGRGTSASVIAIASSIFEERLAATGIVEALKQSIESHCECASYKGDFLREKHGDDAEAEEHKAALAEYLKHIGGE